MSWLQRWLGGELYEASFRPVPLKESIVDAAGSPHAADGSPLDERVP